MAEQPATQPSSNGAGRSTDEADEADERQETPNTQAERPSSEGDGGVVRTVAGRLGHRNASTTLNVYSHFLPEADPEAADLLGRIFDDALLEVTELPPAEEEETG